MTLIENTRQHAGAERGLLVPVAGVAVASFWTSYGAHDWGEIAVVVTGIVVAAALVFALALPAARRKGREGGWSLGLGIAAFVLTLPAFWSGLPLVLGMAAMTLGNEVRNRQGAAAGKAIGGMVLGTVAVLGYLAIYIGDGVVMGNVGFLFD